MQFIFEITRASGQLESGSACATNSDTSVMKFTQFFSKIIKGKSRYRYVAHIQLWNVLEVLVTRDLIVSLSVADLGF